MVAFSKPASLPFSCYEVGHTWTPYCSNAAADVALACFEEGLKIYSSVYILSSLFSGKVPDKNGLKRIFLSIVRSAIFLACNGSGFISMFCLIRKFTGKYGIYSSAFLPSFVASFLAILIERPSRRSPLAIYVTNVASETIYNMLLSRGMIKPIPYGQILIFSITMAALFRWYRTTKDTKNFQFKIIRAVFGNEEVQPVPPKIPSSGGILDTKHKLCPHSEGCLKYAFQIILRQFVSGWGIHACITLMLSLPHLARKPSLLLPILKQDKHVKFGAFLASLTGIYRVVHCAMRWIRGVDSANHSILAGLLAGTSVGFYPNSSIVYYLAWKTVETMYYEGVKAGLLPNVPGSAVLIYSLSTAVLFHASVLEPHNLKPSYWKFLMRITDKKISYMNRFLLDVMGTHSSKLLPDFEPRYEVNHLTDKFKLRLSQQE